MKLLGWMHRKFKQNSNEPLKDHPIEHQPSLDDLHYLPKPSYGSNRPSLSRGPRENRLRRSFATLESARVEEQEQEQELELGEDSSPDTFSDLFDGFLAIGTLGSEPVAYPSTPTFSISVDTIAQRETEATENELKLINDELEKVLSSEQSKEDGCNMSSGRNSYVSTGRSSHCSTITLGGGENLTCPLREYLLGSAFGFQETAAAASGAGNKKEHRTSLGELFQKSKIADDGGGGGGGAGRGEKQQKGEKEGDKSAVNLVKKMLKKKNTASADSTTAETKMHKILQMFHRKVHPENTMEEKYYDHPHHKNKNNHVPPCKVASTKGGEDIIIFPHGPFPRGSVRRVKNPPPHHPIITVGGGGDSSDNKECWIRTDADYLVLEL